MDSSTEIEEQAGAWLARRDSGEWSEVEQLRFSKWLNQSTAHRVAFLRLEEMWERALRLKALGAGATPGSVPSPEDWRLAPFSNGQQYSKDGESTVDASTPMAVWPARHWALAASLLVAIAVAAVWGFRSQNLSYQTPVGGIASVPLSDGSRITLNTDSEVELALTEKERRIELEHGEAFFEVAKDPARPFVVVAGSKRVIAVGTKFSVRRVGDQVKVFVSDGKVRVEDEAARAGEMVVVVAGGIAKTGANGITMQQDASSQVEDYLNWRAGYLVFREVPLAEAVAEFNRYNEQKIAIQDPDVQAIRVSGKIRSTNFEAFVRLLEDGFAVQTQHADGQILLTAKELVP